MSSEKEKTIIVHLPNGQQMIEMRMEELKEYTECIQGKKFNSTLVSLLGGIITAMTVKVKATTPVQYYLTKGLYGLIATTCFSVFTGIGTAFSCGPVFDKIVKAKIENSQGSAAPGDEKDEPSTKELLDFTPSISSHDYSGPINFSSDTSSGQHSQDLGDKTAAGKKRITYDELWRRHQENSQTRDSARYSSEGTDLGSSTENEPSWEKKKIRTNKYGDPLE